MPEIGDVFLKKDETAGRVPYSIENIAEDSEGTVLYYILAHGYYTETQLLEKFEHVTILEELASPTSDKVSD